MSIRAILWGAFGVAVLGGGCAAQRAQTPEIKEEWVARVPADQLEPVNTAREDRRRAEDEATRAEVAANDANNEVSVKKSFTDAADKRVEAAQKALDAAKDTGNQNAIDQAQAALDQANQQKQVAKAELKYTEEQRDVAKAEHEYAKARVNTQDALLEQAEYQVLKDSGDTRVKDLEPYKFEQAVTTARNKEREAQLKISDEQSQLASAEQSLNDARQQTGIGGAGEAPPTNEPTTPQDQPMPTEPEDSGTFEQNQL